LWIVGRSRRALAWNAWREVGGRICLSFIVAVFSWGIGWMGVVQGLGFIAGLIDEVTTFMRSLHIWYCVGSAIFMGFLFYRGF